MFQNDWARPLLMLSAWNCQWLCRITFDRSACDRVEFAALLQDAFIKALVRVQPDLMTSRRFLGR